MKLRYRVILEPNEDGGFTVNVPDLPGCITEGDTIEEALKNAKEAIEGHLEALVSLGKAIPAEVEVDFDREAA